MKPSAPLKEVLFIFHDSKQTYAMAEKVYSKVRFNPFIKVYLRKGLLKYRFEFTEAGKLISWERYSYKLVRDTRDAITTTGKYHDIRFVNGDYSVDQINHIIKGIKTEKVVDTEVPDDI